jgi:hypothetical protein
MTSLSCLSLMEPGQFGSDSGNVVVPSYGSPFAPTLYGAFSFSGASTVSFVGLATTVGLFTEAGSSTVSWVGASEGAGGLEHDVMVPSLFANLSGTRQAMTSDGMLDGA